jgi:hypothetical protein
MPISIRCDCGKTLKVDEQYRGKKVKCPACGTSVLVQDVSDTGVQADAPTKASVAVGDAETPRRRKPLERPAAKGRSTILYIGLGCGAAALLGCLIGGGGAGWFIYARVQESERTEEKQRKEQKRRDDQAASLNNLKQLTIAVLAFHDVQNRFPRSGEPPQGNPIGPPVLSWRVHLLPYVEQGPLYVQIRLNEPWDSAHNRQFWNRMPSIYQLPGKPNDGKTYYQVFRGNDSVFPDKGSIRITDITDGTSNTLAIVEAADSVNWMQPTDIPFQLNQPKLLDRVGNHWGDDTFAASFCDGTVRNLRRTMQPRTLEALITRAGNEVAPID